MIRSELRLNSGSKGGFHFFCAVHHLRSRGWGAFEKDGVWVDPDIHWSKFISQVSILLVHLVDLALHDKWSHHKRRKIRFVVDILIHGRETSERILFGYWLWLWLWWLHLLVRLFHVLRGVICTWKREEIFASLLVRFNCPRIVWKMDRIRIRITHPLLHLRVLIWFVIIHIGVCLLNVWPSLMFPGFTPSHFGKMMR